MKGPTRHPVPDKAEVSVDFPEKFYMGFFDRHAKYEVEAQDDGLMLKLIADAGEKREAQIFLHNHLFAGVLRDWAASVWKHPKMNDDHHEMLTEALDKATAAVAKKAPK